MEPFTGLMAISLMARNCKAQLHCNEGSRRRTALKTSESISSGQGSLYSGLDEVEEELVAMDESGK